MRARVRKAEVASIPADDDNLSRLTTPLDTLACFGPGVKAVILDLFWVTLAAKRLLKQNLITIISARCAAIKLPISPEIC